MEKNQSNSQPLVYYGDKGLSQLLGTSDARRLRAFRDFVYDGEFRGKRHKFPKFPAHVDIISNEKRFFYIRAEVEHWLTLFAELSDQIRQETKQIRNNTNNN